MYSKYALCKSCDLVARYINKRLLDTKIIIMLLTCTTDMRRQLQEIQDQSAQVSHICSHANTLAFDPIAKESGR
mgnify:CR=1 FL=1